MRDGALQAGAVLLVVFVIGVWSGPPFPTVIAITTRTFRSGPGKATGIVVSMSSLGAAAFPWLQGVVLDRTGTSAFTILVTGMVLVMVGLSVVIRLPAFHRAVPDSM